MATTAVISAAAAVRSVPVIACRVAAAAVGMPPICDASPWAAVPVIASRPSKSTEGAAPKSLAIPCAASATCAVLLAATLNAGI